MTAKQAVDILRRGSTFAYDETEAGEFCQAYDMAVEALEKQIQKKPKYKAEDRFVKNYFAEYSYCPVCEKEVVAGDMHCIQCGQAIDWTEAKG